MNYDQNQVCLNQLDEKMSIFCIMTISESQKGFFQMASITFEQTTNITVLTTCSSI